MSDKRAPLHRHGGVRGPPLYRSARTQWRIHRPRPVGEAATEPAKRVRDGLGRELERIQAGYRVVVKRCPRVRCGFGEVTTLASGSQCVHKAPNLPLYGPVRPHNIPGGRGPGARKWGRMRHVRGDLAHNNRAFSQCAVGSSTDAGDLLSKALVPNDEIRSGKTKVGPMPSNVVPAETNIGSDRAKVHPDNAKVRPDKTNIGPVKTNVRPRKTNIRPGKTNIRFESPSAFFKRKCGRAASRNAIGLAKTKVPGF